MFDVLGDSLDLLEMFNSDVVSSKNSVFSSNDRSAEYSQKKYYEQAMRKVVIILNILP